MMLLLRSRLIWYSTLVSGLFFVADWGLEDRYLFMIGNALVIGGVVGMVGMYYPSVAKKLGTWLWPLRNDLSGGAYLVCGFCIYATLTAIRHGFQWYWRWAGEPARLLDSHFVAFIVWLTGCTTFILMLSRDVQEGQIPRENWRWLGFALAIATVTCLLVLAVFGPPGAV